MVSAVVAVLFLLMDDGLRFGVLENTGRSKEAKNTEESPKSAVEGGRLGNRSDPVPLFQPPNSATLREWFECQHATAFRRARLAAGQVETSSRRCVKRLLPWLPWRPGGPLQTVGLRANAWAAAALRADLSDPLLRLWTRRNCSLRGRGGVQLGPSVTSPGVPLGPGRVIGS